MILILAVSHRILGIRHSVSNEPRKIRWNLAENRMQLVFLSLVGGFPSKLTACQGRKLAERPLDPMGKGVLLKVESIFGKLTTTRRCVRFFRNSLPSPSSGRHLAASSFAGYFTEYLQNLFFFKSFLFSFFSRKSKLFSCSFLLIKFLFYFVVNFVDSSIGFHAIT